MRLPADPIARVAQVGGCGCLCLVVFAVVVTAWIAGGPQQPSSSERSVPDKPTVTEPAVADVTSPQEDVKVVDWHWYLEPERRFESENIVLPPTIWVEGNLQNVSQFELDNICVLVSFYNEQGALVKQETGTIDIQVAEIGLKREIPWRPLETQHFTIDFEWPYKAPANAEIVVNTDRLN